MNFNSAPKNENKEVGEETFFDFAENIYKEAEKIEILDKDRNKKNKLLSPNMKESKLQNELHWKIVRTPSFLKWFGDWINNPENSSKVVDKVTGEPIVVYHSTINDIGAEGIQMRDGKDQLDNTVYFSSQPQVTKYFMERKKENINAKLMEEGKFDEADEVSELKEKYFSCFINIKKPFIVKNHNELQSLFINDTERKYAFTLGSNVDKKIFLVQGREDMIQKGYDGIIQKHGDLFLEIPINRHPARNIHYSFDSLPVDGDQYAIFDVGQAFIVPSDVSINSRIDIQTKLDQIRLPFLCIKDSIRFEYDSVSRKNIRYSSLIKKAKEIDFLDNKISKFLLDRSYKDFYPELNKMQKNITKYRNHFIAFIAFYKKDKDKLRECIDKSDWQKEELEELYLKLDSQ